MITNDYYMPPEWETHERTFISWPVKEAMVWPENFEKVCKAYAEVIKAVCDFEDVTVIINEKQKDVVRKLCGETPVLMEIPHNDAWIRDNGPTFVKNEKNLLGINWKFNAWGEKYTPYNLDNNVAPILLKKLGIRCVDAPFVLEGGSIHVDGEGTLITTEECLLNKNRNPYLSKNEISDYLKKYLNISHIIWLEKGLYGDETDGHIDNIACFAKPGVVLIQCCDDEEDPNYQITSAALNALREERDAQGRKLEIIQIPQPPKMECYSNRLTLSYLNFYFVNKGIILPTFGGELKESDEEAKAILKEVFPKRKIYPVDGMGLISEGGNVHCITQQMPLWNDG